MAPSWGPSGPGTPRASAEGGDKALHRSDVLCRRGERGRKGGEREGERGGKEE